MFKKQILGLLYRFTAHCGVILVLQDSCVINVKFLTRCHREVIECKGNILTWYDRTVTKCEPAAPIPEALSWLHPGERNSGFMEFVNLLMQRNESSPEETVERVLVILVCAKDVMVRHNHISLVSRLPQLDALLSIYRLGREENIVRFLVNLLVVLGVDNCATLVFPISHLQIIDLRKDSWCL